MLFYATPIIYPLTLCRHWVRVLQMLNPFGQVVEDVRALVLYDNPPADPHRHGRARARAAG